MPVDHSQATDKSQLRQLLRQQRRALHPWQQRLAALKLRNHLRHHRVIRNNQHLAFYLPQDGEIDPGPLLQYCNAQGKFCYLPVIQPDNHLLFARYQPGQPLTPNRFGIPEPTSVHALPATAMDIVFMPLVGFDAAGHRLGMGGGFYDRSFAFRREQVLTRTQLIGLAHSCQQVAALPRESWDVDVDAIVTNAGWLERF